MRTIQACQVREAVRALCVKANVRLRDDVLGALQAALKKEKGARPRAVLRAIVDNAHIAGSKRLAICQDTGIPVVLVEWGSEVCVRGDLVDAVNKGVEEGYRQAALRPSVVRDPLRRGVSAYAPAALHIEMVKGRAVTITVMPKGFGCENKSQLKMFRPTDSPAMIADFVVDAVRKAGPDACPPYVVGVGIGGTADQACWLAKKALLRKVEGRRSKAQGVCGKLEREILEKINRLRIGPMGLGGMTTALAVHIETQPTHIAGLPVAVNISCHALRSAAARL